LETILILKEREGRVRSIDVANELGFSRPSVSRAMGILRREGLLVVDGEGLLELTEEGRRRAAAIYDRHKVIADYLSTVLSVDKKVALEDACRIEHILSEEAFSKMKGTLAATRKV
jgi:Mn-dependent DtxR family transcriptional regulator